MAIKVSFAAGVNSATVGGLHQWDYGQVLEIESEDLPPIVEVHFAYQGLAEAVVHCCSVENGVASVMIPDICLEQASPITAWVYEVGENYGRTIKIITLSIQSRTRPNKSETVPQNAADVYSELVSAINEIIADMESGDVTVGHAATATHANFASSAGNANNAANATNANHANSATTADTLSTVLSVAKGGTGVTTMDALASAMGAARIASGSYVGTGNGGQNNKNELTFGFAPKMLFLVGDATVTAYMDNGISNSNEDIPLSVPSLFWVDGITSAVVCDKLAWNSNAPGNQKAVSTRYFTVSGKTIQWYASMYFAETDSYQVDLVAQMNESGKTYKYIAIG